RKATFSPDGRYLFLDKIQVGADSRKPKAYHVVWDIGEGREVQRFLKGDGNSPQEELNTLSTRWAAFCPGGDRVVVCEHGGRLRLLDLAGGRQVWPAEAVPSDPATFPRHLPPSAYTPIPAPILAHAFDRRGKHIVVAATEGSGSATRVYLRWHSLASGRIV